MSRSASLGQVSLRSKQPFRLLKETHKKQTIKITEVSLRYPKSWVVAMNPLAKEMERRTELWLRKHGVIKDRAGEEKFRKLAVAEYANWSFPHADAERAEVLTKFLSLWIFYDDVIEEGDDGQQEKIFAAIAGQPETCPEGDCHLRCWWELGQAYGRIMSRSWMEFHSRRYAEWVQAVREESDVSNQFRASGLYPNAAKHLERRVITVGQIPNLDFLEYQMGWELPQYLRDDPDLKALEWHSSEIVAIVNDVFGFSKDQRLRWCNLVACLSQEFQISPQEAFQWVADMHNARIRTIGILEGRLLQKYGHDRMLKEWVQGLRHIMYGFARWHAMAPRYNALHNLSAGQQVRIKIRDY